MDNNFEIAITQNGKEQTFKAEAIASGYTYKIVVAVNDIEVWFEPDEERNYRAVINGATIDKIRESDVAIITAIGGQLQKAVKD